MSTELQIAVEQLDDAQNNFTTVQAILDLLPNSLRVSLEDTDTVISAGSNTPSIDNQSRPWFRFAANGDFLGVYIFISGEWSLAPSLPIGSLLRVANVSVNSLPAGFILANGENGSPDLGDEFDPIYLDTSTEFNTAWLQWVGLKNA